MGLTRETGRELLAVVQALTLRDAEPHEVPLHKGDWIRIPLGTEDATVQVIGVSPEALEIVRPDGEVVEILWSDLWANHAEQPLLELALPPRPIPAKPAPRIARSDRLADFRARQALELVEIKERLRGCCESLTQDLLGERPTMRGRQNWRFYTHQRFSLVVSGKNRGLWYDHAADTGGDMLKLIRERLGLEFPDALAWARDHLGMPQTALRPAWTAEERAATEARLRQLRLEDQEKAAEAAAAAAVRHETVARRAAAVWARSRLAQAETPYLAAREIQPHGMKLSPDGRLRIPLRDHEGKIWSLQHIRTFPNGSNAKRFLPGGCADGMFCVLGEVAEDGPLAFAEGFATGASVYEATGIPTVICFSVGNKAKVMRSWREREPNRVLIDAADNDHEKPRASPPKPNVGAEMAARLQFEIDAVIALPPFADDDEGKDWNDYARIYGGAAVRETFPTPSASP